MAISYFAPSYFSPSYFPGLAIPDPGQTTPDPDPDPPRSRDRDAYEAILDAVKATGAFDQVLFGYAGPRTRAGAGRYPVLMVTPKGWEEVDDADPIALVRRSTFTITIVVRDDDPGKGFDELERLTALVEDVVDRSDLNGTTLAPLSKIRSGRYIRTSNPEQGVELDGEFTSLYQVPSR